MKKSWGTASSGRVWGRGGGVRLDAELPVVHACDRGVAQRVRGSRRDYACRRRQQQQQQQRRLRLLTRQQRVVHDALAGEEADVEPQLLAEQRGAGWRESQLVRQVIVLPPRERRGGAHRRRQRMGASRSTLVPSSPPPASSPRRTLSTVLAMCGRLGRAGQLPCRDDDEAPTLKDAPQ